MAETKKLTSAELKELGFEIKKVRKVVDYSPTDGKANAARKLTQYRDEAIGIYKRIMRLADGEISHNGTKFPIQVTENMINWIMDPLVELHEATTNALSTGQRPKVVTESCPTD